jgi:hypothetical protein
MQQDPETFNLMPYRPMPNCLMQPAPPVAEQAGQGVGEGLQWGQRAAGHGGAAARGLGAGREAWPGGEACGHHVLPLLLGLRRQSRGGSPGVAAQGKQFRVSSPRSAVQGQQSRVSSPRSAVQGWQVCGQL